MYLCKNPSESMETVMLNEIFELHTDFCTSVALAKILPVACQTINLALVTQYFALR